ncbi:MULTISPECIES: DUF937 domain-containing protein [unclassified Ensifer]|uniref:DUF937 domain-containing protein n=1 Tax=unclassified Ensifer TaxID=2633371 RepID=UPI00070FF365|nr:MULTISPECIES: DUF937 domain-containing protein [unclassified Ensifer]KQW34429.1 hypothetical protein ASD02_18190 [Ensifer sp. Root1252]KRC55297.1 hypothetical protein ASE32_21500 [Ensifer sp. Root231]KRC87121.1 hypothetical protein ASE47_15660 [Ensifer sp. Root258]
MASNLVSYIAQMLTPDMIARIASVLGLDSSKVQSAVAAAVPAILAGLTGVAAQPGGAQKIADSAKQQSGSLDNLMGMLAGGDQVSLAQNGSQIISSLFGAKDGSALATAIGGVSGMDQRASGSLLATLAPLVMGGLAQQSGGDLSANGIAGLLASQKDNIAAALPSGVRDLLGGTGLLGSLGAPAQTAAASASQATRSAAASASAVGGAGQRAAAAAAAAPASSRNWLYWVIAALVIAGVLFYLFGRPKEPVAPQAGTPEQSLTVSGVDVGQQVKDGMASLQTALTGVTDAASATAALPKLEDVSSQLDKVSGVAGQLSAGQKAALTALITPIMPTLNGLFDKVLAIPGVSDILKPTIDALKTKLTALST